MPAAALVGVDGDVHHVPDRVVARADQVADEPPVAARRQADAARLGQLEHEHRQRPRRRERAALDRDDLREVGVGEAADVERRSVRHVGGRYGVGRAHVVREQGVAVDGLASRAEPADRQGAHAVSAGAVRRDRHGRRLQLLPKAYRPVADRQPRPARPRDGQPGERLGRDRDRRRGAASPSRRPRRTPRRGGRRSPPAPGAVACPAAGGQRLRASRPATTSAPVALGERAGGGDADPQPGERARARRRRRCRATSAKVSAGLRRAPRRASGSSCGGVAGRSPGAGSWRSSTGSPPSGSTATTVAGVAVSSPRITVIAST